MTRTSEWPRPTRVLAHLSDTHLTTGRAPLLGGLDPYARTQRLLARLAGLGRPIDAVVLAELVRILR